MCAILVSLCTSACTPLWYAQSFGFRVFLALWCVLCFLRVFLLRLVHVHPRVSMSVLVNLVGTCFSIADVIDALSAFHISSKVL